MRNDKENRIVLKTMQFSISVIQFFKALELSKKYVLANQLLRSGTSIGANVFEAQNAESKADFIHKNENSSERSKRNFILADFV